MIAIVLLITWTELWQKLTQATSSPAATSRGIAEFAKGKYKEAAKSFADAEAIRHSPPAQFNLGTAQVASGNQEEGSKTLSNAMRDPKLRADALYNRGSSALAANAFDAAIRDLKEVLRMRPEDAQAKRNLEIALKKKAESQQQQNGGGQQHNPQGPQQNQQQQNRAPAPGEKPSNQQSGQTSAEALLRAVQQQEREELSRMRKGKAENAGVGW